MFHKKEPIVKICITLPEKLYDLGMEKKAKMYIASFSGYIQQLIRDDCGVKRNDR